MEERAYWLGFAAFSGIGPVRFQRLLAYFGSAEAAWKASFADLNNAHIGDSVSQAFIEFRSHFSIKAYEQDLARKQIAYVMLHDKEYPPLLSQIEKPPIVLYIKGRLPQEFAASVAVVGTRKPTSYGQEVTEMFTKELVAAGCVIVSGLALGIDAIAHQTTLTAHGKTIAVLGCGVDCVYPRQNEKLYQMITANGGAIVSDFPPGQKPSISSFPARNRIIAGLAQAVLVTEGAIDSGSLITADFAFANNRAVFAVPGPVTSALSKGPHQLIEKGGQLVMTAGEILQKLQVEGARISKGVKLVKADTKEEQQIVDLLQHEPLHFDELVRKTKIASAELGSMLSLLEVKGIVISIDAGFFRLAEVT